MSRSLLVACCAWLMLTTTAAQAADPEPNVFGRLGPVAIHGSEADLAVVALGAYDPFDNHSAPAANLEYRFGRKLFVIGPAIGIMANTDGGVFGYFNIYAEISFFDRLYFTPQLGFGGYHEGESRDLGGVFQFRETIDLAWRFDNGHRLGLRVAHISNADLHDTNPGSEEYYATYAVPFGPLF